MQRPFRSTFLLPLTAVLVHGGCLGPGMLTDGTSVSVGTHSRGALRHGTTLPFRGVGYVMPERWQKRGRNHGTEELVELLVRVAARVRDEHRGGVLGVADLSPPGGGATPEHRSHHSGRDVDLIFYALDARGKPVVPAEMVHFDTSGLSVVPETPDAGATLASRRPGPKTGGTSAPDAGAPEASADTRLRLDLARNWALIKALVTDRRVPVQWVFVGRPIARLLLRHARRAKEPDWLVARAAAVMHQPSDAQSHMDHYHIRIYCSLADRGQGCVDRGPPRFLKKTLKYIEQPPPAPTLPADLLKGPLVGLLRGGLL